MSTIRRIESRMSPRRTRFSWSGGFRLPRRFAAVTDSPRAMIILIKIALALFLVFWLGFAVWLLVKYERLFGYHPDDPAETPGARTLNLTQVWSCWFGVFAIAGYFLFR